MSSTSSWDSLKEPHRNAARQALKTDLIRYSRLFPLRFNLATPEGQKEIGIALWQRIGHIAEALDGNSTGRSGRPQDYATADERFSKNVGVLNRLLKNRELKHHVPTLLDEVRKAMNSLGCGTHG
jgi:hypothetical protein